MVLLRVTWGQCVATWKKWDQWGLHRCLNVLGGLSVAALHVWEERGHGYKGHDIQLVGRAWGVLKQSIAIGCIISWGGLFQQRWCSWCDGQRAVQKFVDVFMPFICSGSRGDGSDIRPKAAHIVCSVGSTTDRFASSSRGNGGALTMGDKR